MAFLSGAFYFFVDNGLWFLVNLGVPVLLPYLVVGIIAIDEATSGTPSVARTLMRKSVETGQLFWTAIALLAATSYDAISAWDRHAADHRAIGWTIGLCGVLALICTLFVGFSTARTVRSGVSNQYVVNISIGVTIAMCILYPLVHFNLA